MGSKNAYASVRQKITMKMLNIPACAYLVQIFTTSLDFSIDAASAESILMFCLMYSTARKAPVVTACMEAPVNQYTVAPPINRPSSTRGSTSESVNASPICCWSSRMMEKIMVVAPATAVAISTGLAVALKVLPAPSLSSRKCLPLAKSGLKPNWLSTSFAAPGIVSICESSKIDCALSVTGPYESTAMVTGPMPSRPNATRPKQNTASCDMMASRPMPDMMYAIRSITASVSAFQNTEKLPATRPERMVSDAPPSREAATISLVWRELELVKALVSSGINAAASVPHEMIAESFHHSPPPRTPSIHFETRNVTAIESSDVSHTRLVSGASKLILSLLAFCERKTASFTLNDTIEVTIMRMRMVKIHTSSCALYSGITASAMNEMSATPVTP